MKKTVKDIQDWQNKRALVRVDYNVPVNEAGEITDDSRIRETLPTLKYLISQGARVILTAHFGRPKGKVNDTMRLAPVAKRLQDLLGAVSVKYSRDVYSPQVEAMVSELKPGEVLLLENVRFEPGEEANDPSFAKKLASLADVFVNDAFGAAHRAHASTEGVGHFLAHRVAGLLMEREIQALSSVLENPARPYTAIIGGSKVSTKITVLENLLNVVDTLVIGGGMLFTFLKAKGVEVGNSLVEDEYLEVARNLMADAEKRSSRILLAKDVVIADAFKADANVRVVDADQIPAGWMGLDIGPKSIQDVKAVIHDSKTVLWNGPLGVFEFPAFADGTREVAEALVDWTEKQGGRSILGGGDTVAALEQFAIPPEKYTHVSTGGGASLEFLEGKMLPGIAILEEQGEPARV